MSNSGNKSDKLLRDFDDNVVKIREAIKKINEDLSILQGDNSEQPLWNGNNAYNSVKNIMSQLNKNVELLENLSDLKKRFNS